MVKTTDIQFKYLVDVMLKLQLKYDGNIPGALIPIGKQELKYQLDAFIEDSHPEMKDTWEDEKWDSYFASKEFENEWCMYQESLYEFYMQEEMEELIQQHNITEEDSQLLDEYLSYYMGCFDLEDAQERKEIAEGKYD